MGERLIHLNQIGGGVVDEEQAEEEQCRRANHQVLIIYSPMIFTRARFFLFPSNSP